jgi:primase-polymerase (primpol)-like protein
VGNEVVEIERVFEADTDYLIKCKGESVTKEEWMQFNNKLKAIVENEINCISFKYKSYEIYYTVDKILRVGCIENVTLEQIKAITNKLKEC